MSSRDLVVGLRIDVDTMRGTRLGVPKLVEILGQRGIRASFFFSVGPDNMGRHLWRLFRPSFLLKMLRSRAVSLYGLDILLRGTFWPGAEIGKKAAREICMAAADHEIGLHAWDHHREQGSIEKMDRTEITRFLARGKEALEQLIGRKVECMAAPSWKCTEELLAAKQSFDLRYNSDCRGSSIFTPLLGSTLLDQPQVPTTLPTYDEVIGKEGISAENYNDSILELLRPGKLNTLTIHAEVEGIVCSEMFADFLDKAEGRGVQFRPLGELVEKWHTGHRAKIVRTALPGRDGWVGCQQQAGE